MNQANARMADMHNTEMSMRARMEEVQMEKMHTVTQYQAQVDNLSHQLQVRHQPSCRYILLSPPPIHNS